MVRSRLKATAVTVAVLAFLAGCSGGAKETGGAQTPGANEGKSKEKVITFARPEDLTVSLDTANHYNLINFGLEKLVYDTLVELGPDGNLVGLLAESWQVAPDNKSISFKLRKGVKFHNGEEFTSESVKVTLERFLTEKLAQSFLWEDLTGVDTPDATTAVINFKQPAGSALSNIATVAMLPPKAFKEKGPDLFTKPIGTGPFTFVEGAKGQQFVFAANKSYWKQGVPKVDKVIYKPIMENTTAQAAFQRGDVDIVDSVPPDLVESYKKISGTQLVRGLSWDQLYLGVKVDQAPLDHPLVRQAISYAIDREGIVNNIMLGGRPSGATVPQGVLGFADSVKAPAYDPAKAKALLAEAGATNVKIDLIAPEGWYPKIKEVTEAIRSNLQDVGIDTKLQVMEGSAFTAARGGGKYSLFVTGAASLVGDPDLFFVQRIKGDVHKSGFKDEEINNLITTARQIGDRGERTKLYQQIQEKLAKIEAPHIFLFQMENIYAVNGRVSGFAFTPSKIFDLRYVDVR